MKSMLKKSKTNQLQKKEIKSISEFVLGNKAMREKRYEEALIYYDQAKKKCPALALSIDFNIKLLLHKQKLEIKPIGNNSRFSQGQGDVREIDCGSIKPVILEDDLKGRSLRQTDNPLVSIIVSAYNHWGVTANCMASILDNTNFDETPYEVILADDCSSDDTQRAGKIFPGVILAKTRNNMGYLKNNNNAAAIARGKYIVFLNNDTQVQEKWLSELVNTFVQHSNAGVVGSLICTPEGLCMDSGNIIKNDGSGDCLGRGFSPNDPAYCYVRECHYVTAACMMVRRSLWEEIGGYDERYSPAYCEDADFGMEVWKHGYKVFVQPFSRVVRFENISYGNLARDHIEKNTAILYRKWKNELKSHPSDMNNIFLDKDLSANKKTIVVFEGWVPAWDTNAGARCFFMFILLKKALGYNVKLIFNYNDPDDYMDYIHRYQKLGFEVWHPSISDRDWKDWLLTRRYAIDTVFVHRPTVADIVFGWLKDTLQKPIIYFNHDLHFLRMKRELESGSAQHSIKEIDLFKRKELKYFRESTISLTPSLYELDVIRNEFGIDNCMFMPLFVYDDLKNVSRPVNKTQNIIFVAGFNHKPNMHGCMWFMENVWNVVKAEVPGVKLHIVGSDPGIEILQLNELDGVIVHGFVSDERLNSLYSETRLSVIPLLSGAGLKGKLLEALYHKVPVVGTSIAFEGCPDIDKICKPCDTPDEFAKDIILLLKDDVECEKRTGLGFDLISEHFSKKAGLSRMQKIIESAISLTWVSLILI